MARENMFDTEAYRLAQALDLWATGERPEFPFDDLKMTCRMAADKIEADDQHLAALRGDDQLP